MSTFGPKTAMFIYAVAAGASVAMHRYYNNRNSAQSERNKEEPQKDAAPISMQYDQIRCRRAITMPFGGTKCMEYDESNSTSRAKMKT